MITSIYYPSKACKEIIAKNNTSAGIRTRISRLWYLYLLICNVIFLSNKYYKKRFYIRMKQTKNANKNIKWFLTNKRIMLKFYTDIQM